MAKRSRSSRKKSTTRTPEQAAQSAAVQPDVEDLSPEEVKARLEAERKKVMSFAQPGDIDALTNSPVPSSVDLGQCWRMADETRQLYERQCQRAEEAEKEAEKKKKECEDLLAGLDERAAELQAAKERLAAEKEHVAQQKEQVAEQNEWLTELSQQTTRFREDLLTLKEETTDQTVNGLLNYASHLADAEKDFQVRMEQQGKES